MVFWERRSHTLHLCSVRKSDKLTRSSTVNFDKIAPWFVAGASGEGGRPWLLLPEGKRSSCLSVRFGFSTTDSVSRINPWIKLSCLRNFTTVEKFSLMYVPQQDRTVIRTNVGSVGQMAQGRFIFQKASDTCTIAVWLRVFPLKGRIKILKNF